MGTLMDASRSSPEPAAGRAPQRPACSRAPFGGYRQSGLGKEQGLDGLIDFTEVKNIYVSDR